jgi:hypothetical protein
MLILRQRVQNIVFGALGITPNSQLPLHREQKQYLKSIAYNNKYYSYCIFGKQKCLFCFAKTIIFAYITYLVLARKL